MASKYECWTWVEDRDGREGMIVAWVEAMNMLAPLSSRTKSIAEGLMAEAATNHAQKTGLRVRLAHLVEVYDGN